MYKNKTSESTSINQEDNAMTSKKMNDFLQISNTSKVCQPKHGKTKGNESLRKENSADSAGTTIRSEVLKEARVRFFEAELPQKNFPNDININEYTSMSFEEKVRKFFDNQEYKNKEYSRFPIMFDDKPNIESSTEYLERLDIMDEDKDSDIIRHLVLNRYRGTIQSFLVKSERRRRSLSLKDFPVSGDSRNSSVCDRDIGDEDPSMSFEYGMPFCEDLMEKTNLALDSDNVGKDVICEMNGENEEQGKNDFQRLLHNEVENDSAISEETKRSIDEKNIINCNKLTRKGSEEIKEIRLMNMKETDTLTIKQKNQELENLMQKLYIQTTTILEVSKALLFGRKFKNFSGSIERVEAEHVLLIATLRKESIAEEIEKVELESTRDQKHGNVHLSNIRIPLLLTTEINSIDTRYYVCALQCGSTVFTSGILQPDEQELKMNKIFRFEELPNNFEISVQIYSMSVKQGNKNKISNIILKDDDNAFYTLKQYLSPRKRLRDENINNYSLKKTCFVLCGKCVISRCQLRQRAFKVQNIYPTIPITNFFTCEMNSFVKLSNRASGFLTIGEHYNGTLMWNRQWCMLEGTELKFWGYPESDQLPNRIIDMSRCVSRNITQADKSFCFRPRTLHLKLGSQSFHEEDSILTEYYLAADNQDDFRFWSVELNSVLTSLLQWDSMKQYSD